MQTGSLMIALVATVLGCGKSHEPSATTGSAAPAGSGVATGASDITVKRDGKPLEVAHAFTKRMPDGRVQLYLGEGGSCDELLSSMFDGKQKHVLIDLKTLLLSDGKDQTAVGDVYAGPPAKSDEHSTAFIHGELSKGAKVPIDLEVTSAEAKLDVKGRVTAESCGDVDAPPPAAAGAATMTIAGKPFVVRAALARGNDLELSDLPRDCESAHYIGVRLRREGGTWKLDGARMPVEVTGPAKGLNVSNSPAKGSAAPGHVMMSLQGSDSIGAFTVALAGDVDVTDCDNKK